MLWAGLQLCALLTHANPYLAESRELYEALRYEKAIVRLELARQVPTTTTEERREILDLLARSRVALGQMKEAEESYAELLSTDPHAPAPAGAAPKIQKLFQRAKELLYPPDYLRLRQEPAPEGEVAVSVVDPWDRVEALALLEATPEGGFAEQPMQYERRRARKGFAVKEAPHRFYVEARGRDGRTLSRLGAPERPLVQEAEPPRRAPERRAEPFVQASEPTEQLEPSPPRPAWVPWSIAAAAVASASVGAAFALSSDADSRAALGATFADDAQRLDQRARQRAVTASWLLGGAAVAGGAAAVVFFTW